MLKLLNLARIDLDQRHHPAGYNVGINDGHAAGQTIPHLHIHLIPRYEGDQEDPRGACDGCCRRRPRTGPRADGGLTPRLQAERSVHQRAGQRRGQQREGQQQPN